jgi:hypothetical protein
MFCCNKTTIFNIEIIIFSIYANDKFDAVYEAKLPLLPPNFKKWQLLKPQKKRLSHHCQ